MDVPKKLHDETAEFTSARAMWALLSCLGQAWRHRYWFPSSISSKISQKRYLLWTFAMSSSMPFPIRNWGFPIYMRTNQIVSMVSEGLHDLRIFRILNFSTLHRRLLWFDFTCPRIASLAPLLAEGSQHSYIAIIPGMSSQISSWSCAWQKNPNCSP